MPDSDMTPAWKTPLKDLHLARVLFRQLRANMVTWQSTEYDARILAFTSGSDLKLMSSLESDLKKAQDGIIYLAENPNTYFIKGMEKEAFLGEAEDLANLAEKINDPDFKKTILAITSNLRQSEGKPFPQDFSHEPDDIKRIKNLENTLYLAEQAFDKLGDLNIAAPRSYNPKLIAEAYEACQLLLSLMTDVEQNFRHEINFIADGLAYALALVNNPSTPRASFTSHDVGLTLGRAIEHRKPTSGQDGYDLLTYCGAVFPAYPAHIEQLRVSIKKLTSRNPEYTASINKEKMEELITQGQQLSRTIANSNQNSLYFVFNLISLIRQTHTLWTHIYQEAGDLNDTVKNLGREYLAILKYEILPTLFRGVDKLELQLMLKPGRLSKPLMEKIKPWHESLVQTAKLLINFDESNEHLLKIEDARFIELRLQPIQQKMETSIEALHFVKPALEALDAYLQNPTPTIPIDLHQHILTLSPYMLDTDIPLLSRINKHMDYTWGHFATDWYNSVANWVTWSNEETYNKPNRANIERTLRQLKQRCEQLKTNHTFKRERYELQITSVQEQAHRVLYPSKTPTQAFQVSEQDILEDTYFLAENQPNSTQITYQKIGNDTYVQHPEKLSTYASWSLYRSYDQKIQHLTQANIDCEHLINALENHDAWKTAQTLSFSSPYTLALLDDVTMPQPQHIHVRIENSTLQYQVLQAPSKPCKLYLMTLELAIHAGHQGYIWDHDQNQLSYIAQDGDIRADIPLSDHAKSLKGLIKAKNTMLKFALRHKDRGVNPHLAYLLGHEEIHKSITLSCGHHPGVIQKSSIPLADLGCSLTELTALEPLHQYLPHILNELLERGHIQDEFKANCIRWYNSIQPYVSNLDFDLSFTHLFSRTFTKKTSINAPKITIADATTTWCSTQQAISTQIEKLTKKRDAHKAQIKNKRFKRPSELSPRLTHNEFLLDTAQFMPSLEPIKRQLHHSKKTCFKINLALTHLDTGNPNECLNTENHAWFQDIYVGSLAHATILEIKEQLEQMLAYEALQITRNEQLLTQLTPHVSDKADIIYKEDEAFMYFGHIYEPVVMQEESQKKPGELQLSIENGLLRYKFMHYGEELKDEIDLQDITPALTEFNERIVVANDTLICILKTAYARRKQQIDSELATPSPEEALDLYQWYLDHHENSDKIALYKSNAEKKPAPIEKQLEESAPENRPDHLVKHTRLSQYLNHLKYNVYKHFDILSAPLKQELYLKHDHLGLPYPEVGAQNGLIDLLKELIERNPIGFSGTLPCFNKQPDPDNLRALETPQQVLLFKRLLNIIHYLEQIVLEMEKINHKDFKISYVMHLVISYLYVQEILPLLSEIQEDPVFSSTYADIAHHMEYFYKKINHENKYYIETNHPDDKGKNKPTALYSTLNLLKMLPERLASSTDDFEKKRPELKQATKKSVRNIEKIIQHYGSSWSYVLLFLDLPTVQHLLSDIRHDIERLLKNAHEAVGNNLSQLNTEYLAEIILEADRLEHKLGWKPGFISQPIKELLDEFYKGLITPLTPTADEQVQLLCGNLSLKQIEAAASRKYSANASITHYKKAAATIQTLLNTCDDVQNPKHEATYGQLDVCYQSSLSTLKSSLNSADVHLLSIQEALHDNEEAQRKKHLDCFVFDEKKSQLYYLDALGKPNPQTGCKLYLTSIPEGEDIPEHLEHEISMRYPDDHEDPSKINQKIDTHPTTLIQHGDKYYLYTATRAPKTHKVTSQYTELNAEVIASMHLNFSRTKILDIHTKYQDMYDEIAAKTGLIYPIHLKNTFKTVRFITKKKESGKIADRYPETLYLSEHTIHEYVSSNSDFSLKRHRVSVNPGCCLISLEVKPTDYYELALPAGYSSYYAQVQEYDLGLLSCLSEDYSDAKSGVIYLHEHNKTYFVKGMDEPAPLTETEAEAKAKNINLEDLATKLQNTDLKKAVLAITSKAKHTPKNRTDVLYFIDTETSSITTLPIPENKQGTPEIKQLTDTRPEEIFDAHNFIHIEQLTGHRCDAALMSDINHFKPNAQNFKKLQALTKRSLAYYQGMIKTSEKAEAVADDQLTYLTGYRFALLSSLDGDFTKAQASTLYLSETPQAYFVKGMKKEVFFTQTDALDLTDLAAKLNNTDFQKTILAITAKAGHTLAENLRDKQEEKNTEVKKTIYTDHFNSTANNLVSEEVDLQCYKLRELPTQTTTTTTTLRPNFLYISLCDGAFDYRVINPAGKQCKSCVTLTQIKWSQNKQPESIDELIPYLPEILKITAEKGDGHTRPHSLADDYKARLAESLSHTKEQAVADAVASEQSEAIDIALAKQKIAFNNEQLAHYEQLDAINQAVGEFRLYLSRTRKTANKTSCFFESTDTLESKTAALDYIDTLSSDLSKSPQARIAAIQKYLKRPGISDNLMAYHTYTSTSLQSLLQCVFRLFEAVGLYTPEMTQRLDKMVDAVQRHEPPLPASNAWSFFSKTTREKIKDNMLTPRSNPTPSDDDSEAGPEI
ncbi:MAG: hypothetical protein P1U36_02370 [Legionellaceae bacterium]|nr:hypothetical protein [Legionellaceae bacterium]